MRCVWEGRAFERGPRAGGACGLGGYPFLAERPSPICRREKVRALAECKRDGTLHQEGNGPGLQDDGGPQERAMEDRLGGQNVLLLLVRLQTEVRGRPQEVSLGGRRRDVDRA